MIVAGKDKEQLEFYLIKKPQSELISVKKDLKKRKNRFKALFNLIHFSPLQLKEKSLYNLVFPEMIKVGGL